MNARPCDCFGCHVGRPDECSERECSECGAASPVALETLDIKRPGQAYRPCADCRRGGK